VAAGTVVFISRNQGILVVQHERGFSVVELLGSEGEFSKGDRLNADWLAVGGETFIRSGAKYDAYFQGCWGNGLAAVQVARKIGGG
jgi:hypothetical protein